MRSILLILSALALAACSEPASSPPGGAPTQQAPVISALPSPVALPAPPAEIVNPADPYASELACHALIYDQSAYGQAGTVIVEFGPSCPPGEHIQLGLFPDGLHAKSPPMPANGTDIVQVETQVTIIGTYGGQGYQVATRLPGRDWYTSTHSVVPGR